MTDYQLEEGKELELQFEKRGGLLPVIVQDSQSRQVLMMAYTDQMGLGPEIAVVE